MGCSRNGVYCYRLHHFAVSVIIFLISASSQLRLFSAEGRRLSQTVDDKYSKTANYEQDKWSAAAMILRAQIGSRPPRCERRCSSCGRCEAIQVPTNPQSRRPNSSIPAALNSIAYARGDDNSNYKPMSWKCKCGNLIFNP